jgi:hypothetical protein
MAAKLLIFRGDEIDRVELTERDLRIGRAPENDIVLEDQAKTVSRYHAELRHEQGNYVVIDVNSQNGIWVDGQRVQRAKLAPGRPIVLGKVRIELEETRAEAPAAPAPAASPEAETLLGPPQRAPVAAPVAHRPSSSAHGHDASAERTANQRARGQVATTSLVSRLAKPKLMAIGLGILVLAVVLFIVLTPSTPSSNRPTIGRDSVQPGLPVLEARQAATAPLLANFETSAIGARNAAAIFGPNGVTSARAGGEAAQRQQINRAKLALARGDYGAAIALLEPLAASSGAGPLLEQARQLRTQQAEGFMREGTRLEESGTLVTAYRRYMAARAVDTSLPGIDEAITRIESKMKTAGADAYTRARQYDALGRTERAIPLYETAVELLPPSDPNRSTARSRLAELKSGAR